MRIYADQPGHRLRQIVADVLGVVWCILAVLGGKAVYELIDTLAGPGRLLEDAGDGMRDNLSGAGDNLSDIPLVGGAISAPFEGAEPLPMVSPKWVRQVLYPTCMPSFLRHTT